MYINQEMYCLSCLQYSLQLMDPTQIYGITAGGILFVLFVFRLSSSISIWIQDRTFFLILKYLVYPLLWKRHGLIESVSRWRFLLTFVYWSGTAACNFTGVNTLAQVGTRAGILSTIHLIPLLFSNRLSFAADILGLSFQTYSKLHSSLGSMAFAQALLHVVIFFSRNPFHLKETLQFYGFLVSHHCSVLRLTLNRKQAGIAFSSLVLLTWVRHPFYEFFLKSHFLLAMLVLVALWRHVATRSAFSQVYLLIGASILASTTIMRYARVLFRQLSRTQFYAISRVVRVHEANDAVCLQIDILRPWRIKAGQYIYVGIPFCSFWSFFQSHPFMITWWDQDWQGRGTRIYLLIKVRWGFTRKLLQHLGAVGLRAWVDGPYGKGEEPGEYGSVMMFASGIGIAAQVPYVKELLNDIQGFKVRTRSILLIWELEKESEFSDTL